MRQFFESKYDEANVKGRRENTHSNMDNMATPE